MEHRDLVLLREWFTGFCSSFRLSDSDEQRNLALKEEHTGRVCVNIRRIAAGEALGHEKENLAEAIALFHDLGRFPQYCRYKTFKDSDSVNHGHLSAQILVQSKVLDKLACNAHHIIIDSVRHHNAFAAPAGLDAESALYLRLIRDADKLDIWRVFLEFYRLPPEERASAVSLGFPDLPACSPQVLDAIGRGEMVKLSAVASLNDFKLLQLSWVFDLNFPASFQMLDEKDYVTGLAAALPADDDVLRAVEKVREFALSSGKRK